MDTKGDLFLAGDYNRIREVNTSGREHHCNRRWQRYRHRQPRDDLRDLLSLWGSSRDVGYLADLLDEHGEHRIRGIDHSAIQALHQIPAIRRSDLCSRSPIVFGLPRARESTVG